MRHVSRRALGGSAVAAGWMACAGRMSHAQRRRQLCSSMQRPHCNQLLAGAPALRMCLQDPVLPGELVPPAHVAHSWCPSCDLVAPPNARPADCVEAAAELAAGAAAMPAVAAAGSLDDRAGAALRLVRGASVLSNGTGQVRPRRARAAPCGCP